MCQSFKPWDECALDTLAVLNGYDDFHCTETTRTDLTRSLTGHNGRDIIAIRSHPLQQNGGPEPPAP